MKNCTYCGHTNKSKHIQCPQCGRYNSKIDDFLAEEAAKEDQRRFKTKLRHILQSSQPKQAFIAECRHIYQALAPGSLWLLYLVAAFIFAGFMTVL